MLIIFSEMSSSSFIQSNMYLTFDRAASQTAMSFCCEPTWKEMP